MKIILAKDIESLGTAGDVITVADGYARNYLLPKEYAFLATKKNLSRVEKIKKEAELKRLALENEYKAIAKQLEDISLTFKRKADEEAHLFGSVSENDIVEALAKHDIDIHKSNVVMEKHLKEIGEFNIQIKLSPEIIAEVKVFVEKE